MPGRSHSEQRETGGDDRLSQLLAENAQLRAEIAQLRQLVEQLQRRLGLDSSNSGKPPAQQRTRSQRGRTGKRPGGQPGHKGVTLRQTDTPDRIETHLPPSCADCGAPLAASDTEGEPLRRQVFDLKWPRFRGQLR